MDAANNGLYVAALAAQYPPHLLRPGELECFVRERYNTDNAALVTTRRKFYVRD